MARTILVIDDEDNMRWVLEKALKKAGYDVVTTSRGDEGLRQFARHAIDLVLLDLKMPGMDGLSVLREMRALNGQIPILLLTAFASVPTAVEALKVGATDYIRKPFDLEVLQTKISYELQSALKLNAVKGTDSSKSTGILIGISRGIVHLSQLIEAAASTDYPIIISGERGSGRATVARIIHQTQTSSESKKHIVIDCDLLPQAVLAGELGELLSEQRQSVETSKVHREPWEQALGGTLVLTNLDGLAPNQMLNLATNIQSYLRSPQRPHGLRLQITLPQALADSCSELFPRSIRIQVPPLRERTEDIPPLISYFAPDQEWDMAAQKVLREYAWPGNVSELRQVISYAAAVAKGKPIGVNHLPPAIIQKHSPIPPQVNMPATLSLPRDGIELEQVEKSLIEQALTRTEGNKTQAARLLGISRATLLYRLEKHGLS